MMPGLLQVKIDQCMQSVTVCVKGQEKMSKSDPNSAIFMEDSEAEVNLKIKKAFCPPAEIQGNPCIAYVKHIVLPWFGHFTINRKPENGGDK